MYEPVLSALSHTGWRGGGRFAHVFIDDTWPDDFRNTERRYEISGPGTLVVERPVP